MRRRLLERVRGGARGLGVDCWNFPARRSQWSAWETVYSPALPIHTLTFADSQLLPQAPAGVGVSGLPWNPPFSPWPPHPPAEVSLGQRRRPFLPEVSRGGQEGTTPLPCAAVPLGTPVSCPHTSQSRVNPPPGSGPPFPVGVRSWGAGRQAQPPMGSSVLKTLWVCDAVRGP